MKEQNEQIEIKYRWKYGVVSGSICLGIGIVLNFLIFTAPMSSEILQVFILFSFFYIFGIFLITLGFLRRNKTFLILNDKGMLYIPKKKIGLIFWSDIRSIEFDRKWVGYGGIGGPVNTGTRRKTTNSNTISNIPIYVGNIFKYKKA
ncbi:MAG: hypothetical protein FWF42_03985, partial [Streptococcaceae bacterium]|nr:hypothetical protein [Streptococcaceae bacterium]